MVNWVDYIPVMVMAKEYRRKAVWGLRKSHVLVSDVKSKEYVGVSRWKSTKLV